jgi:catechol 2,3-dioxygenase-like lactoylglutathione lyase family enzyme
MNRKILGIHHVTAIAGDPQQNVDFYTGVLGLRLVKRTVNFDDPDTYHLYFGDEVGHPGTILTFFPWPDAYKGRRGTGQLTTVSFSVPEGAIGYWTDRFSKNGVPWEKPITRFNEEVLAFEDPDGLRVELVAHAKADKAAAWDRGPVAAKYAIRRFYGVTLSEEGYEKTATLLTETLGFHPSGEFGNRFRFTIGDEDLGSVVDVMCLPDDPRGLVAVGTVHHVAWRTPNDEEQQMWRQDIIRAGLDVTPVINRQYFHSIYFREPGGVLLEIATDPPGFTLDEPVEQLGTHLMLPPWLERDRTTIERNLPIIHVPQMSYV